MKKIAIIGSRTGFTKENVRYIMQVEFCLERAILITGGAPGVDSFAIEIAKGRDIETEIIRPINPANKMDYLFRNIEIITKADRILALWDGKSKGTKFVIDYAQARNKELKIIKK